MSKQHADGAGVRRKLEALRDDLFTARVELQQAYEAHDAQTFKVLKEIERRHNELKEEFAEDAKPTVELIADLSRRRDNIDARLRGMPQPHKDKLRAGVDLLRDARRRIRIHQDAAGVVSADVVDGIVDAAEEEAALDAVPPASGAVPPGDGAAPGDADVPDADDEDLAGYEPGGAEAA